MNKIVSLKERMRDISYSLDKIMSPVMKAVFVILVTLFIGGFLIAMNDAKADGVQHYDTIEDFKQCSLWIKGQNRTIGLIEPLKEYMDKISKDIETLTTELLQIEMSMEEYLFLMYDAEETGNWEVQEAFYRMHNQAATKGNAISQEMLALNGLYLRLAAGIERRITVFNKLNDRYLTNCMVSWPTNTFDVACTTKQFDTIDFCEKFPND